MKRLWLVFMSTLVLLTAFWLASLPSGSFEGDVWQTRKALIYYTGILAIGFMSVAIILAARPVQIEGALGGLDKFYRLHKWLGIGGAVLAVVHWLSELVPRSLVRQGWLERPPRGGGGGGGGDPGALALFHEWRGVATAVGEWTLYLLLILVALALWKRVPYRSFFKTHRLMAVVYLLLVFHSVVLMDSAYWTQPIGPFLALLMTVGSAAAATSLFRRIGQSRRAVGHIEHVSRYADNAGLEAGVRLETAWPGHDAGQFAFVTFEDSEGAHPFTISSAWRGDGRLMFTIKGIGDYTRGLPQRLRVGQAVTVEGPYGRFDFRGHRPQLWVAGGVGITPFIARLQALVDRAEHAPVDLIYSTNAPDAAFIANIRKLAERVGVRFQLLVTQRDGRLTLDRVEELVPEWRAADIWFCGPAGFGQALRNGMVARGLPPDRFHQELFEMR